MTIPSSPVWQPTEIRRFIRNFDTGAGVVLVLTDAGEGLSQSDGERGRGALLGLRVGGDSTRPLVQAIRLSISHHLGDRSGRIPFLPTRKRPARARIHHSKRSRANPGAERANSLTV